MEQWKDLFSKEILPQMILIWLWSLMEILTLAREKINMILQTSIFWDMTQEIIFDNNTAKRME